MEGFGSVDTGATVSAWFVSAFVAGPGEVVWHAEAQAFFYDVSFVGINKGCF